MAKKDIRGHLGGKRIQLCFIIFNLLFLMNVVSSWKVKVNFAHVKPHASNLLFVGILCGWPRRRAKSWLELLKKQLEN